MRDVMHLCVCHLLAMCLFVEFMVTGKKVTDCVHDFIYFEEKVGF